MQQSVGPVTKKGPENGYINNQTISPVILNGQPGTQYVDIDSDNYLVDQKQVKKLKETAIEKNIDAAKQEYHDRLNNGI